MSYIVPIHRPSSVRHALKLNLLTPEEDCLVVSKSNRLEIWVQSSSGLALAHSRSIHGRITMLQKVRPPSSDTSHLFVGTARFQYFTLSWNPETRQLDTIQSFVDVSEKHMRDSQSLDRCIVDPTGKHLCLELFEGVLSFIRILRPRKNPKEYLDSPEQIRITELFVRASTFLYSGGKAPKLALLYQDGRERVRLVTYLVSDGGSAYKRLDPRREREDEVDIEDGGASHLIPVPRGEELGGQRRYVVRNQAVAKAQLGGVIVVGETRMLYYDDESKATVEYALDKANIFVAWTAYDGLRYLLGDEYGWLHLLTLLVDGTMVTGMEVKKIGQISTPSAMVCLDDDFLFIGSHIGDSQVVKLNLESAIEVVQTMDNIAPILDFTIMDMGSRSGEVQTNEYSSGQARIVAGSGAFQSGSLRSVRSGVGLEDIGLLGEMDNIRGLYSLRSHGSKFDDTLLISFLTETRIFRFDSEGEVEEVEEYLGLSLEENTLLAANVSGGRMLQVTPSQVVLVDAESGVVVSSWQPTKGETITTASANDAFALISADGKSLISLDIGKDLTEIARQDFGDSDQVACLYVPNTSTHIGLVGLWQSGSVSIIDLKTLEPIQSTPLRSADTAAVPRSLILSQILPPSSGPTLLVAMSDGIVLTFSVDQSTYALSNRKSIVLGTQQANLRALPRADGLINVFATCEHSSLIYGSEGRIVYSAVTAEDATFVCPFNAAAFPGSIVVATASEVKISQIDTERRTHVKTLPMGETVRRIAYSAAEKAFGIGTIKRELIDGEEVVTSGFRLVDEIVFSELGKPFQLGTQTEVELVEAVIRASLPTAYGEPQERFIVGTSFLDDLPMQAFRGRILVFGVDNNRSPYVIAKYNLKGACRCLGIVDGKIVAALVKTIVVFEYTEVSSTSATLQKVASYRTASSPVDIGIDGNNIAIADLMQSVSLVKYKRGEAGVSPELVEVARHLQNVWATAVGHIEGDTWLEADADGNLIVLRRNQAGVTLEDRKKLEVTGEFGLGEMVNRIRKINVEASEGAAVVPRAFLATTEGSLYLFGTVAPSSQDLLIRLQSRLAELAQTPGNIPWASYRSFRNAERETEEPWRFVDGELVERFLDLDESMQQEVCKGLVSVQDGRDLVEGLRRLH